MLNRLRRANREPRCDESGPGHTRTFSMEEASVKALEKLDFKPHFNYSAKALPTRRRNWSFHQRKDRSGGDLCYSNEEGPQPTRRTQKGRPIPRSKTVAGGGRFSSGARGEISDSGRGDGCSGLRFGGLKTGPGSGGRESVQLPKGTGSNPSRVREAESFARGLGGASLRVEERKVQLSNRQWGVRFPQLAGSKKNLATRREILMDFRSEYVVAAQLTIPTEEEQLELTVCSAYFAGDIGVENPPTLVKNLLRHCRRKAVSPSVSRSVSPSRVLVVLF
ncbi:hypothetical protein JTB14_029341 [Gonioctena quinquepunctata]|nr:hypothetical protein JTB14_029341 [Gonioctena quinquepunctata]